MTFYTIKIAFRNIFRNKLNSAINIACLSLGLSACIIIYLIISFEFSFDRFHPGARTVYSVHTLEQLNKSDAAQLLPSVKPGLAGELKARLTGISAIAPYHILGDAKVLIPLTGGASSVKAQPVFTSSEYFKILPYAWVAGDASTAMDNPFRVVLTESRSKLYFGNLPLDKVMNQTIIYNDSLTVRVAGIIKDWSENTDFPYQEFISLSSTDNSFIRADLQLEESKGIPFTSRLLIKLGTNSALTSVKNSINTIYDGKFKSDNYPGLTLVPLKDFHFTNFAGVVRPASASLSTLYSLSGIAIFILLLAITNYISLATAQAITREKNTAIRKIIGGSKRKLMNLFLTESWIIVLMATLLAAIFVNPVLNLMRTFISPDIHFSLLSPGILFFLCIVIIVITFAAGWYPALSLASTRSSLVSGSLPEKNRYGSLLRKGLNVFQFSISLIFIIFSAGMARQISYMSAGSTGFQTKAIVLVSTDLDELAKVKVTEENLRKVSGVEMVARENIPPMGVDRAFFTIEYGPSRKAVLVAAIKGDENYIPLYGMKILAGRNLLPSDTIKEFVINETLRIQLGFRSPEEAIGKQIFTWGKFSSIIGVVADFHQASFRETIQPQVITSVRCNNIAVRLNLNGQSRSSLSATMKNVKAACKKLYPEAKFEFAFFDETIKSLYENEQRTLRLMNSSTAVAIFISCLGLFGLTLFIVRKRVKEVSIRKVLGASASQIVLLLSKDFAKLIFLSLAIASPVAWYFLQSWLQDYVYRVHLNPLLFVFAGLAALFVALLIMSLITIRAAMANPVKNLRNG